MFELSWHRSYTLPPHTYLHISKTILLEDLLQKTLCAYALLINISNLVKMALFNMVYPYNHKNLIYSFFGQEIIFVTIYWCNVFCQSTFNSFQWITIFFIFTSTVHIVRTIKIRSHPIKALPLQFLFCCLSLIHSSNSLLLCECEKTAPIKMSSTVSLSYNRIIYKCRASSFSNYSSYTSVTSGFKIDVTQ